MKHLLAGMAVAVCVLVGQASATEIREPVPVPASEPQALQRAADLLIARPVAVLRLVAGVAMLPVTLPVALSLGDPGWALEVGVQDPLADLIRTPLGTP